MRSSDETAVGGIDRRLDHSGGGGVLLSISSGGSSLSGLSSSLLSGELLGLSAELGGVGSVLACLSLGLLLLGLLLSDLLLVELLLSLLGVGILSRDENASEEEDGEEEAGNGVPDKRVSVDDAEGEDAPPVASLEDPEDDQAGHNLEVVEGSVLVDTLVVRLIDRVVPVAVPGDSGGFLLFRSCVDSVHISLTSV